MPGLPELLIILVIVIIIFGAGRLPQLGEALGRGIRNFKKASKDDETIEVTSEGESSVEEKKSSPELEEGKRAAENGDVNGIGVKEMSYRVKEKAEKEEAEKEEKKD